MTASVIIAFFAALAISLWLTNNHDAESYVAFPYILDEEGAYDPSVNRFVEDGHTFRRTAGILTAQRASAECLRLRGQIFQNSAQ